MIEPRPSAVAVGAHDPGPGRPGGPSGPAGPTDSPSLQTHRLSVTLGRRPILRDLDLRIDTGWTAIVGPNGAGKSTLLKALAGLLPAAQRNVALCGRSLDRWPVRARAATLAWMAQHTDAIADVLSIDLVRLGRLPHLGLFGARGPADDAAVNEAMRLTECSDFAYRRIASLSGGERQRVLLARLLAVQAPVLLLDEPTTHLDAPHQVALMRLLRQLAPSHTLVSVLHDLSLALAADRLVVMRDGRVTAHGAADDARLHRALEAVFDGAIRVVALEHRWVVVPRLETA